MRATARRLDPESFGHRVETRDHQLTVDEPRDQGGEDDGPTPQELLAASLASCTAITVEMYAKRKGWELGAVEVECGYEQAERGRATKFALTLRVSAACSEEQLKKLRVIASKCPVHRVLEGEVSFEERVERLGSA